MNIDLYSQQSPCSDPRAYAQLLDKLPTDIGEMTAVIRNLIQHYRAGDEPMRPERMAEIDHRWMDRLLETDQRRFDAPLAHPRPAEQRVAGCCRDFSLLTIAALRHRGVPARSRIGFADYFEPEWHCDHVIVDYWDGERWIFTDPQLNPADTWNFDVSDMPRGFGDPVEPFVTAAQVWTAYRRGDIDPEVYGVAPELPFRGPWFIRNYVINELAHRLRDELLLWDVWGDMSLSLDGDLDLIDRVAELLLAADLGDEKAERELADLYAADPRLHPAPEIMSMSPTQQRFRIDLAARTSVQA